MKIDHRAKALIVIGALSGALSFFAPPDNALGLILVATVAVILSIIHVARTNRGKANKKTRNN